MNDLAIDKINQALRDAKTEKEELFLKYSIASQKVLTLQNLLDSITGNVSSQKITDTKKTSDSKIEGYPHKGSWETKVLFTIKHLGRFLHNREIASWLIANDSEIKMNEDDLARKLSHVLSKLRAEDKLINEKHQNNNQNAFWGPKVWLDENGKIKPEFQYHLSAIGKDNETIEF